jgi:hypothetical protein
LVVCLVVRAMELNSRDFSLNFRGFEHQDADRIERFRAFCEANFGLPPEDSRNLATPNHTFVLTHGSSPQELEALAEVLREIGARVEVEEDTSGLSKQLGAPSTQELHRLFGPESEEAALREGRACRFSPVGSSLYLINPSASSSGESEILQRRAQRRSARDARSINTFVKASSLGFALLTISVLALGVLYLKFRGGSPLSLTPQAKQLLALSANRTSTLPIQTDPSRAVSGRTHENGYSVELKGLLSGGAVSVRSFEAQKESPSNGIRRLEGEPIFLSEAMPGVWEGSMPVYAIADSEGTEQRQRLQSNVTIRIGDGGQNAVATVTLAPETLSAGTQAPFASLTVRLAE